MELAYHSVESVMGMQSEGSVYLKPRTTKSFGNSKLLADMTASIPGMNIFGIKHYVVNNGHYFYYIYLYDFREKNLLAIFFPFCIDCQRTHSNSSHSKAG